MILGIYFLVFFLTKQLKERIRLKVYEFPKLSLGKNGIQFFSLKQHKIKIRQHKYVQFANKVFIKLTSNIIVISNIKHVFKEGEHLYFKGLGRVRIEFDCSCVYKYFNIEIISEKFSMEEQKQEAILDLINNNFEINNCKLLKKYIKNIKNILNINIFSKKIVIKQNKFHLPFVARYKINNKIKEVYINQTLEENQ